MRTGLNLILSVLTLANTAYLLSGTAIGESIPVLCNGVEMPESPNGEVWACCGETWYDSEVQLCCDTPECELCDQPYTPPDEACCPDGTVQY